MARKKPRAFGYVHIKQKQRKRSGRHSKRPNKRNTQKPSRGQGG